MKATSPSFARSAWLTLSVSILAAGFAKLQANPKGAQVTNGNITITESSGVMTINQTTPRAIIHWQDFSIGAGELTQFQHLDAKSATLNRVVGGIPTTIQGTLQANGQVYIVNPNGILIGPGGRINTAAFVASTLDVPDAQFMAGGDMHFSGNSLQGVVNLGSITATDGDVILMGHYVQNAGTISAPNGTAALAAGNDILLQPAGDERVVVNSGIPSGGNGVENSGSINAARAELKAAGGNVYALAINNTGVVKATGIAQMDGRIILSSNGGVVQNSGKLTAKNADGSGGSVKMDSGKSGTTTNNGSIDASADDPKKNGGTVELLGDTVNVGSSSVINVNGANAGTVAIGVSAELANQTTTTGGIATVTAASSTDPGAPTLAQQTTIQANSRIMANSTANGNGGRVTVWSEQRTIVGGTIEAKSGDTGGNGGLIETSGRTGLTIIPGTKVDTSAPKGKAGTWLLDPAGISVDATATDATINSFSSPTSSQYAQNALTNHVLASDVLAALMLGNVVIDTVNSTPFPNTYANKDIEINAALAIDNTYPASTLTLSSAGGISVNAAVGTGTSNVILTMQSHGDININAGGKLQMNGVSITAITGSINVADQILALNDKNIFLIAPTGSIAFTGSGYAGTSGAGAITLDTHLSSAGTITSGSSSAVSAGKLTIASGTQGVGTAGSPFVTAVDDLSALVFRIPSNAASGGGVYIKNTSGGTLHLGNILVPIVAGFGGAEINNTAGTILLDNFVSGDHLAVPGNIKLTAGGASSDIRVLNTNSSSINSHNGSVTLIAGRNVQIGDAATNTWGVWVMGQTKVDVQAGGDVTVAGSELKAGGSSGLSITAGGDVNIILSNSLWSVVGTSGDVPVNITTGAGKTFNLNTGSQGGLLTNLPDNITGIPASGGSIYIHADDVVLNAPVNAGAGGTVNISPLGIHTAINIGTTTKNAANQLGLSQTDLSQITAGHLQIYTSSGDDGLVHVSAFTHLDNTRVPFFTLESGGGGGLTVDQNLSLSGVALVLNAFKNGSIGGSGNIFANSLTAVAPGGDINLTGPVGVNYLMFNAANAVSFPSASNSISAINKLSSDTSAGFTIAVTTAGTLVINGSVGNGSTNYVFLQTGQVGTGQNLILDPGAQIFSTNLIDLFINGDLINNAGPTAVLAGFRPRIWSADLNTIQKGGLPGSDYSSAPVTFPNDPLGVGSVFYYANVAPPTPPANVPSAGFQLTGKGVRALLSAGATQIDKFAERVFATTNLSELSALLASDPSILRDPRKLAIWSAWQSELLSFAIMGVHVMTSAEIAQRQAEERALQYQQEQLDAVAAKLGHPLSAAEQNAFFGITQYNFAVGASLGSTVNPSSLSPAQISQLSESQLIRLLAAAGMPLTAEQSALAQRATISETNLTSILKSGPVNNQTFAAVLGAGASNLTMSQILDAAKAAGVVSQGGGNAISNNGSSVVSQGGGNAISNNGSAVVSQGGGNLLTSDGAGVVSQGGGNFMDAIAAVVSQGGGNLTFAAVVSQGGGNAISNNGSSVVSQGGGNLLTSDGAGVVSQGGGNFYAIMAGMIGSDGMGLLAKASAVVSQGGGNLVGSGGASLIGHDGASLIGHDGASLIGHDGASLIGHDGASLIGHDGASLIGHDGASLTGGSGNPLQLQGGAGAVSGAMNNK